ncbi:MAG: glycosyltransferase family 2 protein [Pirellulaceae bacterium]|nr:glycosyltransferase family 2 protein [Pirellulaceae bacterium]
MLSFIVGAISIVITLVTLSVGVCFIVTVRTLPRLGVDDNRADSPELTVIVPARNEEQDLKAAVESILAQQDILLNVVIVNDHSVDATGKIADQLARGDSRVRVVHNPPLTDGWFGKTNAMQQGVQGSTSPIFVFCDADVKHHPRCFITAWHHLQQNRIDLLSLCPLWVFHSFWENSLLPQCMVAGTVQLMPPSVNDPKSSRAVAAGAFIMIRRATFDAIGGFESVRNEMLDDVEFARSTKRSGHAVRFALAPALLQVRLFKSNRGAFWGLTKNVLAIVNPKWLALPTMFLPIVFYSIPFACLFLGVWNQELKLALLGIVTYATQLWITWLSTTVCQVRWSRAIFFPTAALPIFCCYTAALYYWWFDDAVAWRGRVLKRNASDTH